MLKEGQYKLNSLPTDEQEKIFDLFKKSYDKSVGASWSKDKFYDRAINWLFFGDGDGFVAVRPQQSGLYKLVGVAGNPRNILNGFDELIATNKPIWGMVSSDIQKMASKKGFRTPPSLLVNILIKMIPSSVFGGTDFDINSDGSLNMKYSDVGTAKKYLVGNDEYFKQLKNGVLKDKIAGLPLVARKTLELFLNESDKDMKITKKDITEIVMTEVEIGYGQDIKKAKDKAKSGVGAITKTIGNAILDKLAKEDKNTITNQNIFSLIDEIVMMETGEGIIEDLVFTEEKIYEGIITPAILENIINDALYEYYDMTEVNLNEAEYRGRKVSLGKISRGDVKKYKVFVKNAKGNVVKVNFGDPNMEIRRDNPKRRKNFRSRHNCDNPGPRWKARYWACKTWSRKPVSKMV